MNRIFLSILALIIPFFSSASADEKRQDGVSESGKIGWHIVAGNDDVQVLISEADQGESAALKLCDVPSFSHTKVFVSPDDRWIIVQSGGESLGISLTAFRRENGMSYQEQPKLDFTAAVLENAFEKDSKAQEKLDYHYADFVAWSADSKSFLLKVAARGDGIKLRSYFAIYDLEKRSVGFDLRAFNAGAVIR